MLKRVCDVPVMQNLRHIGTDVEVQFAVYLLSAARLFEIAADKLLGICSSVNNKGQKQDHSIEWRE